MKAIELEVELGDYSGRGEGARQLAVMDEDGNLFEIIDVMPTRGSKLVILIRPETSS